MVDQEKIHNQCLSDDPQERIHALEELKNFFSSIPDHSKQKAWSDLLRLTNDKDIDVRSSAVEALGSAFSQVPDKQKAWNDLLRLTNDEDSNVGFNAASFLIYFFPEVPNKQKAWNDLYRLTIDENTNEPYAASILGRLFSEVPDKQKAWSDLHRLTNDESREVRSRVAEALGFAFSEMPDKQKAWSDLHRLTNDKSSFVRSRSVEALGSAFSQVPDKQQAWNDLHRLTNDKFSFVRRGAAGTLRSAFSEVTDKQQAWNDLHRLTNDEDSHVRLKASYSLVYVFSEVPDKQQAWNYLHRLTNDEDWFMRYWAACALEFVFSEVPDKQQAWNDLHRLTNDENNSVKRSAAEVLGSVISEVPDKQQAWNDLHRLTKDEDSDMRSSSNHSLGRFSIFMASQANKEEDYKKELEKAIEFFEIAAKESNGWNNLAQFCLPFYRTFHSIIFKKQEAIEEVNKYLEEAKSAIKGSESKKQLFEAVQNLAEALKEVQNLGNLDLEAKKGELNFYRKYCDHAAEIMKCTDEKAPFATEVLRKGLPILDRNLKKLIEEIQEKARAAYKESVGTEVEETAHAVCTEVQKWEIGSQEEMAFNVENLIFTLESNIPRIPENQYIFNRIQQVREQKDVAKQYGIISTIIPLIPKLYMEQTVGELKNDIKGIKDKVDYVIISLKPGITQEIEISSGIEIAGTGAALITTIPLQEISYAELKEDLQIIKEEHVSKLSELPKRLANKIKGYLLLKDREDIVEQLT